MSYKLLRDVCTPPAAAVNAMLLLLLLTSLVT
jgi:hypothetical protein